MEHRQIKSLAGKLGYLGVAVSPFASFASSYMQQCLPSMTIAGMKEVNGIVREVVRKDQLLVYLQPSKEERMNARVVAFSDAGFPHQGNIKKRRVSNSSGQAEAIAAVTALGCALNAVTVWRSATNEELPITLVVDSLGLHRSLATQSQPRDLAMAAVIHTLRMDYESGLLSEISWIAGTQNPADALTKPHSGPASGVLEQILCTGRLPVGVDDLRGYGPALVEEE
eukprot:IDg3431t1